MMTHEQHELLRCREDGLAKWMLGADAAVRRLAELLDIRPAESLAEQPPIGLPKLERLLRSERIEGMDRGRAPLVVNPHARVCRPAPDQ